jgi:nicotinate-nucleotide adenylyltransferase
MTRHRGDLHDHPRISDFSLVARTRSARRFEVLTPEAAHERPFLCLPPSSSGGSPQSRRARCTPRPIVQVSTVPSFRRRWRRVWGQCGGWSSRPGDVDIPDYLREDIGLSHGNRRPRANAPPGRQSLLAHLKHRGVPMQRGAPVFFAFPRLSCYASAARIQGGIRRAAKRLAKGACRDDGGAFRRVVRPAACGHVHVSREALKRLGLDRVWWLVSPGNPLKDRGPAPSGTAHGGGARHWSRHPRVIVTDIEARLGTRYTGETIEALIGRYPGVRFVWLMGADNLAQFHRWQRWDWIMRTVPICVLARPGHRISARTAKAAQVFRHARMSRPGAWPAP